MLIYNNFCLKRNLFSKRNISTATIFCPPIISIYIGVLPDAGDGQSVTPAEGQVLELVKVRHDMGDGLFSNDRGVREIKLHKTGAGTHQL